MRQVPYLCNSREEFVAGIEDFCGSLRTTPDYSCILATVYVDSQMKKDVPELIRELKSRLPQVQIVGGTVSANITAGVMNLTGISLTFSVFFSSEVEIFPIAWDDEKNGELGKKMLYRIRKMDYPVAMEMISSGYSLKVADFLRELSNIPDDIVVLGGIVDDGTVSGQGFVFTADECIQRGMVIVVYKGKNLLVNLCSSSGWQPLGRTMRITGLADNGFTITQLDDAITIRDAYEKYLGVSWDSSFLEEAVIFPVCVNRNGTQLNRLPRMVSLDGSANYGAEFHLGEQIQICYGNPSVVIQGTYAVQYDMLRFQPEGIFAVSCWARKVLLNRDVNQELEVCRSSAPSTGIYALGEYMRDAQGQIHTNNMLLSILGMREGGRANVHRDAGQLRQRVKLTSWGNSVISHMLHFAQTVSQELEEKNKELEHIANTDKLTAIYNRRAIEARLQEMLDRLRKDSGSLSIMLLDLDNFKNINDKFGHLVGDASLMQVAKLIRQNIPVDAVAGRWGGDEFLVLLPGMGSEGACATGERIRSAVEGCSLENGNLRVSVSVGVATYSHRDEMDTLFRRADKALYTAKYQFNKNNVQFVE